MGSRRPLHTTRPEDWTPATELEQGVLGIRWVFPMPAAPVTRADGPRISLGRSTDCDLVLTGSEISRCHAELLHLGPDWVIRDLGSRNGVHVNGRRVVEASLATGHVLRIGEWVGVVRRVALEATHEVPFGELAHGFFGSTLLSDVLGRAKTAASSELRIVLEGETGTGKECVAQAIHRWSGRRGPFIGVNCAALPAPLAEAELFGHRKGAFTSADRASVGHLRAANGGTLLLDEITDLPYLVQAKLLRALEQRAVVPLGESTAIPIDVRIVTATQEPLRDAVAQRRFRADLWGRLDGLTVQLPPLRARSEDSAGLFARMLPNGEDGEPRVVDARLVEQLCLYDWPGNVREVCQLSHQIAVLHATEPILRRSHLPARMLCEPSFGPAGADAPDLRSSSIPPRESFVSSVRKDLGDDEHQREQALRALVQALRLHRGNLALAARELGISRQRGYRMLEELPDRELSALRARKARYGGQAR